MLFWIVFVGGLLALLLGVDLYFKLHGRKTLSHTIHDAAKDRPIFVFSLGMIVGLLVWHFFASNYGCAS
jgi:hypothetical protein